MSTIRQALYEILVIEYIFPNVLKASLFVFPYGAFISDAPIHRTNFLVGHFSPTSKGWRGGKRKKLYSIVYCAIDTVPGSFSFADGGKGKTYRD